MSSDSKEEIKHRIKNLGCLKDDPLKTKGVLLSNEIKYFAENHNLIDPFDEDHLEPASYDLTVGEKYSVGEEGTVSQLGSDPDRIIIEPFQVVIIQTTEFLNLPRFLIGRWNIRVTHAYDGLLWVGGPQVDPGYAGYLYCPIYNLSDTPVPLKKGEEIASIDFVKTTPFTNHPKPDLVDDSPQEFDRPPGRLVIEEYTHGLVSAAVGGLREVQNEVGAAQEDIGTLRQYFLSAASVIAVLIVVFFTALSVLATRGGSGGIGFWQYLLLLFSATALVLSIIAVIGIDE